MAAIAQGGVADLPLSSTGDSPPPTANPTQHSGLRLRRLVYGRGFTLRIHASPDWQIFFLLCRYFAHTVIRTKFVRFAPIRYTAWMRMPRSPKAGSYSTVRWTWREWIRGI